MSWVVEVWQQFLTGPRAPIILPRPCRNGRHCHCHYHSDSNNIAGTVSYKASQKYLKVWVLNIALRTILSWLLRSRQLLLTTKLEIPSKIWQSLWYRQLTMPTTQPFYINVMQIVWGHQWSCMGQSSAGAVDSRTNGRKQFYNITWSTIIITIINFWLSG